MSESLVWFITGCSSGIGYHVSLKALERGDKVIATSRNSSKLEELKSKGAYCMDFNVNSSETEIKKSMEHAISVYGTIDVVVNNSGYGEYGAVEECGSRVLEEQYRTNLFGPIKVVTAILPHFRKNKKGLILNVGSSAAFDHYPILGAYASSKAALKSLSITLDNEIKQFNIRSIFLAIGMFRTNLLSNLSTRKKDVVANAISDYDDMRNEVVETFQKWDQKQTGDPRLLADKLIHLAHNDGDFKGKEIPSVLIFGKDSIEIIAKDANENLSLIKKWENVIVSTDRTDWV
ncbi:hypothetical protein PACTADRAFT_40468 [Pachysolen tannophilus NRRL Y-2460]|uniref:Uncharacterized protein n=1 Tax=Pachysolen tannophilus NRRL Y-2460 TaxID=669874 RepID=A0A1E4TVG9_PACTA|nr:hypothetical protein PACTADRAFT_40468 [Pachysolen tannophilus NRRL Y-2460]